MSEHIIETEMFGDTAFVTIPPKEPKEEIVRCRDCEYMHRVRNWLGVDVDECWLHADPQSGALGKNRTEPDGFCAWGERK